jgi:hypothetical protein
VAREAIGFSVATVLALVYAVLQIAVSGATYAVLVAGVGVVLAGAVVLAVGRRLGSWRLAVVSLVLVLVGGVMVGANYGRATADHGSAQQPPGSNTPPANSTPNGPSTPNGTTSGTTASGGTALPVYWTGLIGLGAVGLNLDTSPPSPGGTGAISVSGDLLYLNDNGPTQMALWTQAGTPTADICRDWVSTHPANSLSGVNPASRICIKTAAGRYAFLRIDSRTADGQGLQGTVTVWGN